MRYYIEFDYSTSYDNSNWLTTGCMIEADDKVEAINKCKELYNLDVDYVYRISVVDEVPNDEE